MNNTIQYRNPFSENGGGDPKDIKNRNTLISPKSWQSKRNSKSPIVGLI